ncbi:SCP2 sterol-binding domain-containing protein [Cysteiniphilum halobium]|uniref:SCP2 sterol-binding domain-containing protein n=1 Tax=Cysteiniphilum halobium TaxID=2219059 RepID=UPI000E65B9F5|nr:SCP2 sterol-binding domain-containing protein [Cysteiniphilum halobium]
MKEQMIIKSVNLILDKALSLDPQKAYLLHQLHNQSLSIAINDLNLCFCFQPSEDNLTLELVESANASHLLMANSGILIAMALSQHPQSYIQQGEAKFIGDIHVLECYRDFFKAIRPDLIFTLTSGQTTPLNSFLAKPLDVIKAWLMTSKERLPHELREYIQYEKELFPCKEEVEDFFSDIQILKQDLTRITAKINHYLYAKANGDEHD